MKKNSLAIALALSALATSGVSADNYSFSSNASIVSQYLLRGYDVNQEKATLQGSVTFEHEAGFSLTAWGSGYDFGSDDGVELDYIGSYSYAVNDDLSFSVGFIEYTYSGDSNETTEYNIGLSAHNFSATYYRDVDLETDYYELGYDLSLNNATSLKLHYGHYEFDAGGDSNDFGVTLNYQLNKMFSVNVGATTIDVDGLDNYVWAGVSADF